MIHLNLVDLEKSDIKYKISHFPDGQQSVQIEGEPVGTDVVIHSRFNSFKDLELIICATQALKSEGYHNIALHVPYFLGARSDRKFAQGGVNYLKQVVCPIINAQDYAAVIVLDPHSDVLEACINKFEKVTNEVVVKYALDDLGSKDDIVLVSPDAGAYKKIFDIAQTFEIDKVITATKVRDIKTGQILHTEIPTLDQHNKLRYVIVDDICDSGKTLKRFKFEDNVYTATLHYKTSAEYEPHFWGKLASENEWIVYPWEQKDSQTIADYATKGK